MKQGTIKTLGAIALGAVAVIAGGGTASAVSSAPVPGGSASSGAPSGSPSGAPTSQLPATGQPAGKPAAAKPQGQGMLGQLPALSSLPTGSILKLG